MGLERAFVEIFRAKDDRFFGPVTLAQLISLGVVLVGALIAARTRRPPAAPSAV
jgi:prolipoprotein diacylglyceryltransferase